MLSQPTSGRGKRRRIRRTFLTREEAKAFLGEQSAPALSPSADVTVGVLLDGWQEWVCRRAEANQLAPNTVAGYGYATAHVRATFGRCLAAEVTVDDVERFLTVQLRAHSGRYVVLQRSELLPTFLTKTKADTTGPHLQSRSKTLRLRRGPTSWPMGLPDRPIASEPPPSRVVYGHLTLDLRKNLRTVRSSPVLQAL